MADGRGAPTLLGQQRIRGGAEAGRVSRSAAGEETRRRLETTEGDDAVTQAVRRLCWVWYWWKYGSEAEWGRKKEEAEKGDRHEEARVFIKI